MDVKIVGSFGTVQLKREINAMHVLLSQEKIALISLRIFPQSSNGHLNIAGSALGIK